MVRLWCQQGRFKNARQLDTPRGAVWLIPESDLDGFEPPKMGRPRKPPEELQEEKKTRRKAIARWENEGGAVLPKKRGTKR